MTEVVEEEYGMPPSRMTRLRGDEALKEFYFVECSLCVVRSRLDYFESYVFVCSDEWCKRG